MRLSIITINFNNAAGLEKTAESIVGQTIRDFEWIVIDGGSTDGSVDVIRKYEDRITYWVSEKDSGIYNAMNKGVKVAGGGSICSFLTVGIGWQIKIFQGERFQYFERFVSCFDMDGISELNQEQNNFERNSVIERIVPECIRYDYESGKIG